MESGRFGHGKEEFFLIETRGKAPTLPGKGKRSLASREGSQ